MSSDSIKVYTGGKTPKEYADDLTQAINETLLLIFERRSLDLHYEQCYGLYMLVDLMEKLRQVQ